MAKQISVIAISFFGNIENVWGRKLQTTGKLDAIESKVRKTNKDQS